MSEPRARIAIVEDDALVREHLLEILRPDYEVAGVAGSVREGKALIAQRPALMLVDIGLPDGSGLDLIADVKRGGDARVLVLTSFGDRETVVTAIEAGADGYLLKDSSHAAVAEGVAVTLSGGAPISASAAVYLLERLRPAQSAKPPADKELSPREVELLKLFAKGASYKDAARELGISPLTVGGHVKSIYRKLAVHSRGEAVYEAVKAKKLGFD